METGQATGAVKGRQEVFVPAERQPRARAVAVASAAALVLALVGAVAVWQPQQAGVELESRAKQQHFHAVFEKLEKKPPSGEVAQQARARKDAIAAMSDDQARSVLVKWGFQPPALADGSKEKLVGLRRVLDDKVLGDDARSRHGEGASRAQLTRLRAEASDDDLSPHRPDLTDERDEEADERAVEHDRAIANRTRERRGTDRTSERAARPPAASISVHQEQRSGDDRENARSSGFGHLEEVAVSLAKAVHEDQQGIVQEKRKLRDDRDKLINTRELIDKALAHLAEKSGGRGHRLARNDDADFTIKVRRDLGQQQQQYERRDVREERERGNTGNDYWKIPIRPRVHAQEPRQEEWAHIRRRRAPDSAADILGDSYQKPGDALAMEEAASADGLMNVPASMASRLIGQQSPSLVSTANDYVQNVFGSGAVAGAVAHTSRLRSAQPVAVQQYRKVRRMEDAIKGGERSMVATYGQNYASGTAGQPYAAENPGDTSLGETAAQVREDNAYLTNVFDRK